MHPQALRMAYSLSISSESSTDGFQTALGGRPSLSLLVDPSTWQDHNVASRCHCLRKTSNLFERIPQGDIVPFDSVLQLHHAVIEQWRQTARCRHCSNNRNSIEALATASDRVVELFEAASQAYTTTGDRIVRHTTLANTYASSGQQQHHQHQHEQHPCHSSAPNGVAFCGLTCARAQMSLGDLVLQDDEANMLATQAIYESLMTHYNLLEGLRDHQSSQNHLQTLGKNNARVQDTIDRLLGMLGRIHWEQNS